MHVHWCLVLELSEHISVIFVVSHKMNCFFFKLSVTWSQYYNLIKCLAMHALITMISTGRKPNYKLKSNMHLILS